MGKEKTTQFPNVPRILCALLGNSEIFFCRRGVCVDDTQLPEVSALRLKDS